MHDPTTLIWRCTVQCSDGSFCDSKGVEHAPFPICAKHAMRIAEFMEFMPVRVQVMAPETIEARTREREESNARYEERMRLRDERFVGQTQVYYVRIHDHIKIGYTQNIRSRMGSLRVSVDNVMATEPGDRKLERQRHLEFADERVGRREDFNPSRRLLAHIEAIKAEHGEPKITTYQSGE